MITNDRPGVSHAEPERHPPAITNQIIAALESGPCPPWRRPWRLGKNAGAHANVVSKQATGA